MSCLTSEEDDGSSLVLLALLALVPLTALMGFGGWYRTQRQSESLEFVRIQESPVRRSDYAAAWAVKIFGF